MEKVRFRRKDILQQLYAAVDGISSKTYVTSRPTAVQEGMADFCVVRISQPIIDRGATYQDTYGQISLFARDRSNGIERCDRLDEMAQAVTELFPIVTDLFSATDPRLLPGGSDELGFHSVIIQFRVTINK